MCRDIQVDDVRLKMYARVLDGVPDEGPRTSKLSYGRFILCFRCVFHLKPEFQRQFQNCGNGQFCIGFEDEDGNSFR